MAENPVLVPDGDGYSEFTEKRSRFIGWLTPAETPEQVRVTVKRLKEEHPQARHVVHAFVLGDDGSRFGFSDDGEPHGTAGRPVYDALKGSGLTWAALYVVRYFGGTKLGTGGLVSAYSRCAADTAAQTPRREKIPMLGLVLTLTYPQHQRIRDYLPAVEGVLQNETFAESVTIELLLPAAREEPFREFVRELGRGGIRVERQETDTP